MKFCVIPKCLSKIVTSYLYTVDFLKLRKHLENRSYKYDDNLFSGLYNRDTIKFMKDWMQNYQLKMKQ